MINVETCRGCGRPLYVHKIANLVVRLEIEALEPGRATAALLDGRELWRLTATSMSPARPAELAALHGADPAERPHIVQEHRCTVTGAPASPPPVLGGQPNPKGSQAATQSLVGQPTPSWAPQTAHSSARPAANQASELQQHPCDHCGRPVLINGPAHYTAIELGATVVWAIHEICA